jgi:hypothetical protein
VSTSYPIKYKLGFPLEQWSHAGVPNQPIVELCNTSLVPYRYSITGWLLCQHGVPNTRLCVNQNKPGVIYGSTKYPTRFLYEFPRELLWWEDPVPEKLFEYVAGETKISEFPDIEPPRHYFDLLTSISEAKWALTPDDVPRKLSLPWRIFWLREACRIGGGIGVQFGQRNS